MGAPQDQMHRVRPAVLAELERTEGVGVAEDQALQAVGRASESGLMEGPEAQEGHQTEVLVVRGVVRSMQVARPQTRGEEGEAEVQMVEQEELEEVVTELQEHLGAVVEEEEVEEVQVALVGVDIVLSSSSAKKRLLRLYKDGSSSCNLLRHPPGVRGVECLHSHWERFCIISFNESG